MPMKPRKSTSAKIRQLRADRLAVQLKAEGPVQIGAVGRSPRSCKCWSVSIRGCPKPLLSPTEITAQPGWSARTSSSVVLVAQFVRRQQHPCRSADHQPSIPNTPWAAHRYLALSAMGWLARRQTTPRPGQGRWRATCGGWGNTPRRRQTRWRPPPTSSRAATPSSRGRSPRITRAPPTTRVGAALSRAEGDKTEWTSPATQLPTRTES